MKQSIQQRNEAVWRELVELEPQLGVLLEEIRAVKDNKRRPWFCANLLWLERFKPQMLYLVGDLARNPDLGGCHNYDVAYGKLYDVLPDCRNCACVGIGIW